MHVEMKHMKHITFEFELLIGSMQIYMLPNACIDFFITMGGEQSNLLWNLGCMHEFHIPGALLLHEIM